MVKRLFAIWSVVLVLSACGSASDERGSGDAAAPPPDEAVIESATQSGSTLDEILNALPEEAKARIPYRHPKETLEFFGIEPGMTVVDTTPGDVWYAGILAAYLGPDGKIIGADRPIAVWASFGGKYAGAEFRAEQEAWPNDWPAEQVERHGTDGPSFGAVAYGRVPETFASSADVVMMVRELHNIAGADETHAIAKGVIDEVHMMLKPGGVFGIVQHRAPETASAEWANGKNGYLKTSMVIALAEASGFTLEAASEINANPKDQPTEEDYVWRLPPVLNLPDEDEALRDAMAAIGESDRMTLKFRKKS